MMRRFFFTRWKQFFTIMLIPILAMSIIAGIYMYAENTKSSVRKTANSLELLNENMNSIMSASAYQYDLLTYNPSLILSLRKLLSEETLSYTDIVFLNTLQSLLNASANVEEDYVDSIYLYLDGYDSFLSSTDGLLTLNTAKDTEWFDYYSSQDYQEILIEPREFLKYSFDEPIQYLTLYRAMSNTSGVIIINLNIEKLTATLETSKVNNNTIMLLDKNGQVLCSTNDSQALLSTPQFFQSFVGKTNDSEPQQITLNSHTYIAQTLYNPDYEITLLSLLPTKSIFTDYMPAFLMLLGVVLSNCGISMALAYVVTPVSYTHLDVYKRQTEIRLIRLRWRYDLSILHDSFHYRTSFSPCILCKILLHFSATLASVDVYKRQLFRSARRHFHQLFFIVMVHSKQIGRAHV